MPLLEGQTVEFPGGEKYAVENHVIQLVVWPQFRFVEGVTRLANFLGIKSPIRSVELKSAVFFIDNLLHVCCFASGVCNCWRGEIREKFVHGRNVVRGLVLELICRP